MKTAKTGGFTLVELVVVIAILGILAGICVPVYTGYIQKANEAADLQLLDAVNTAFAAACAERGKRVAVNGDNGFDIWLNEDGIVNVGGSSRFAEAFMQYFGENINTPFRRYDQLYYDAAGGRYVARDPVTGRIVGLDSDEIAFPVEIGGSELTVRVNAQDLFAVSQSAFGDSNIVTMRQLMTSVQSAFNGRLAQAFAEDEGYQRFVKDAGVTDSGGSTNLLAFYAAQNTKDLTFDKAFNEVISVYAAYSSLEEDETLSLTKEQLSSFGLIYGLATAYVYRYPGEDVGDSVTAKDVKAVLKEDPNGFWAYLNSDEGRADLEGYISCMNMLSDNMDSLSTDVYGFISENGYTTDDVIEAVDIVLGRGQSAA